MNLLFPNHQKLKIAILLFFVMGCALLIRTLEDRSLDKMQNAFISIYNDRLVPANDLLQIAEHTFKKRQFLDEYSLEEPLINHTSIRERVNLQNTKIDSLLKKYESTYFVKSEKGNLLKLKKALSNAKSLENRLPGSKSVPSRLKDLSNSYQETIEALSTLSKIQAEVGGEITESSKKLLAVNRLYSTVQVGLAIVIGLSIMSILYVSKIIHVKSEKFRMN